jgi:hypothetical protein
MARRTHRQTLSLLTLSRRLLVAAVLVELLIFLPRGLVDPQRLFNLVWVGSSVLGIVGFLIAYNVLGLKQEALEASGTWYLFGPNIRATAVLMFGATFFVPFINLVIFVWTYFRIGSAVQAFERERQYQQQMQARRSRVMGP